MGQRRQESHLRGQHVAKGTENRVFGKRAPRHVLILASGEKIRHMTIRPWMAALIFCFFGVFAIGYLAATSYLVIRDDLIGATMARQARMQHDYEDRIAALRAQLDRITSRQLLDQQVVEQKVEKLLEQQNTLFDRHGKLGSLLNRAEESGLKSPETIAPTALQPASGERQASLSGGSGIQAIEKLLSSKNSAAPLDATSALGYAPLRENMADRTDRVFSKVTLSLKYIEKQQLAKIADLTTGAAQTADAIATILKRTGVDVASEANAGASAGEGVGGPYVEPQTDTNAFDASLDELDAALTRLESVRETARDLPFGNPAPGHAVTSRFGNRIDPFLGRLALHAGIDFQAETGQAVKATGAGKVTIAGLSAGYGNLVEIDHGQGIATRYGHMSKILVKEGDMVSAGDVIGRAGSTGRSTGPHVHYEVRRDGNPVDPSRFLNAGMKLTTYLN
ncbi:Murein DD-endopeptidase MepM and murein hydrolase activator NlpD, contain LysM domain [Xaviernesmea oryzae]|uniref:Murein DD-endopeptidase MepM and murein hydrolase activator NlpD, contain LysM domain n=1 Tax=Xaviernesmea oryzae TaxID=464029 RepID=A0A1X7GF57_9HYPH|nr:Murein DD-endopeptidase MepM and murein hydrolase activator NlpD, contain LysM domain [Xaviernesmea oryzae]